MSGSDRLLDDRFAPITYSIGFLQATVDLVADELARWRKGLPELRDVRAIPLNGPLEDMLRLLDPLSVHRERELLVSASSGWTAYFSAFLSGSDPDGPISVLSRRLGTRGLVVADVPDTIDASGRGTYGGISWSLIESGEVLRVIQAVNDGGRWRWSERGDPLPFELKSRYAAKRVRERLDSALVAAYSRAAGVRVADESAYGPVGRLVRYRPAPNLPRVVKSLEEARRELKLPPPGDPPMPRSQ